MVALVGPTGAGKSDLAMEVALRTGAEIISVDSMQVYRGLDIGTAKPTPADRRRVRHHMIDVVDPETAYSVAEFRKDARRALSAAGDHPVLIVGGSGLHFRALVDPMTFRPTNAEVRSQLEAVELDDLVRELLDADPSAASHVDLANRRRVQRSVEAWRVGGVTPSAWAARPEATRYRNYEPEIDFVGFGIDRVGIESAIDRRLDQMWAAGLLDEVRSLADRLGPTAGQGVGYSQLLDVVNGDADPEMARTAIKRATIALVKRQRTFFRRDPRLTWLEATDPTAVQSVLEALS